MANNDSTQSTSTNDSGDFALGLEIDDKDLLMEMSRNVTDSQKFWNENERYRLEETVEQNLNLYLPNHWKDKDVYDHDLDNLYQDPRIWISVETVMGIVSNRAAFPEVRPDANTIVAAKLAEDLQKGLFAHAEKYFLGDLQGLAGRNMLIKRIGWMKLRFVGGSIGDIVPEIVDPLDVVVDKDARFNSNPRFIAERIKNKSAEELIAMFPDAEQKILKAWGVARKDKKGDLVAYKSQLAKRKDVWEIWFTYFEDKKELEGVMVCDLEFKNLFGKQPNPNWNYEEDAEYLSNFLDRPPKPYVEFVYLSDGISFIPPTSAIEQARSLQQNLDKRGYQITANADQASGGMVFNIEMLSKEDASKLVGAPDERIGVKGKVSDALARVAPPLLPQYVLDDKFDTRAEIDNVFGTHRPSRGENTANRTLGQDVLQQQQDMTRQDEISRSMTRSMTKYYRILTQMMKVYYRDEHWFKITGEDGQFDSIVLKSDLIRDGIDVAVKAGSMMPVDKFSERESLIKLAQMDMVDPLTLFETLGLQNPRKLLERTIKWKTDPMSFMADMATEEFSREAFMDIQLLNRGEMPKTRGEISPEHLAFHRRYMLGGEFEELPDEKKLLHLDHMRAETTAANKLLQKEMTQGPSQVELDQALNKEAEQGQLLASSMAGQPDMPSIAPENLPQTPPQAPPVQPPII